MLRYKKKKRKLMERCVEFLSEFLENKLPQSGKIAPYPVHFEWPGTKFEGLFVVEADHSGEEFTGRRIKTAMRKKDSDKIVSHYYFKGTNKELAAQIKACDIDELVREFDGFVNTVEDFED